MRIGIFGGAFNPPHIGHVQAAQTAALQHNLDLLIVVPTGTPPHKALAPCTPEPEKRFSMTKNAFCDVRNSIISDIEIYSTDSNYMINTAASIQAQYPDATLYLLVGNDMYDSLNTWKDSENLLKAVTPILLPRDVINISSTELRNMLPDRKGLKYLSDTNYSLIIKHRLYDAKPDWRWLRSRAHSLLDPLRIPHVDACEKEAIRLAERWNVDPDDAQEAAILHDITKKLDFSENMCIIAEHGNDAVSYEKSDEKLLHSITGAILAQSVFGVSTAVAEAIRWHTTGRAGMSTLDKIIYIADYIESTRDFPEVELLRKIAYENIDAAVIMGLEITLKDLDERGLKHNDATYDALNDQRA